MYEVKIVYIICDCGHKGEGKNMKESFYASSIWECPKCGNIFAIIRYKEK